MFYETVKLAIEAIARNAMRSFLTVLGIVIGVGAVIAMVTIGNGTTAKVAADMARLGSNLLFVRPGQFGPGRSSAEARSFTAGDISAMIEQIPSARAVTPIGQQGVVAIFGNENRSTTVIGTDSSYLVTQDWELASGRDFLDGELRSGRAACILGQTVRSELFGNVAPLGQRLRVGKVSCEVIGLLEEKGQSAFGSDRDDIILMPIRTFQRRISGTPDIRSIYVSARSGADTATVQRNIEALLRERRNIRAGQEDDFTVRDMKQIAETQLQTTNVLTALLGAVAGVSLVVGGIGIMNIMLVSVTERTREIGIRLAIGAQARQVLMQFLVEAVVLSLFGGILGIAAGLGLAWLAAGVLRVPYLVDWTIVTIAFGFSACVGIAFGYFPARRAASLDPIDALRRE
ncbi:MAG: ABC transporter permease [Anderseniella sp.]|jgi:putative ABC transport system permease protein|nr:ABC transporter permease [Anderseniella sp.]